MRAVILLVLTVIAFSSGDVINDMLARGIPAMSYILDDSTFSVEIEGTLADGDTLLKHYGGTFFILVDSIASGWEVVGMRVGISRAVLAFSRDDMFTALNQICDGVSEDRLALWVLEHTRVFNR